MDRKSRQIETERCVCCCLSEINYKFIGRNRRALHDCLPSLVAVTEATVDVEVDVIATMRDEQLER